MVSSGSTTSGVTIPQSTSGRSWIASAIYPLLEKAMLLLWWTMSCTFSEEEPMKALIWEILQRSVSRSGGGILSRIWVPLPRLDLDTA